MNNHIEVDFYICGVYHGRRKIARKSICGALLSGNIGMVRQSTAALVDELNQIPGIEATMSPSTWRPVAR